MASAISKVDSVGVPSQDPERSRAFYVETLRLRPDEHARYEFWVGQTCFAIWEPEKFGMGFQPQKNAAPLLHVEDVATTRAELEAEGVQFVGRRWTRASATWRSSRIPTGTISPCTIGMRRTHD